jgi:hypothetical protein
MMVDFRKLMGSRQATPDPDPLKVFASLDRKTSHAALRQAQEIALAAVHSRRTDRDLVLKMPTGLGKSAVGLLFLQSHMLSSGRGGVYLCPTVQLVKQVLAESERLGVRAFEYPAGQPQPHADCLAGRAVTVCTYDKLFNARSTFERDDVQFVPCAIACDDAHSGIEEVRDAFTLGIRTAEPYDSLRTVIAAACASHERGLWEDICGGQPGAAMELPYWLWMPLVEAARSSLTPFGATAEFKFVWPRLRDRLRFTRLVISADTIEISPLVPPVEEVRPFHEAAHRLFMSATLADDSALVSMLGCADSAAKAPILAGTDSPPGERLVIAPSLIDPSLDRRWLLQWGAATSKHYNVVVLCPSDSSAADWVSAGARAATRANIESVVSDLRDGSTSFAVFAQRYDGIDLPDNACRVLIIDGMPFGQGLTDTHDASRARLVGGPRNRLVYRIEQGMGRAVRSPADFAFVVLAGPELAAYVSNADVRPQFGQDLQLQLDVAQELATYTKTEGSSPSEIFNDLAGRLLRRDANWRAYYDDRVRRQLAGRSAAIDEVNVLAARLEREASLSAESGDIAAASRAMSEAIALAKTEQHRASLLEEKARYVFAIDPGESMKLQAVAYAGSRVALRPPIGASAKPPRYEDAAARMLALAKKYSSRNGLVAAFAALRAELAFDLPPSRFEALLQQLGEYFGADSSRPENETGHGPDNLFLWADLSLVAEAKNQAKYSAIPKHDAEQLLHSMEWFRKEYPHALRPVPILVGRTITADAGVHLPAGTRVLTPELLGRLLVATEALIAAIASKGVEQCTVADVNALLASHGLGSGQFLQTFTRAV